MGVSRPVCSTRSALAVSFTAILLGATACSSSGSPAASPSVAASLPGASVASTPAVQSPAASSSSPAPAASAGASSADLTTKLLTAADIGDGFTETAYDGQDGTSPCDPKGTPGIDEQVPPAVKVGRDFVLTALQAQAEEELLVYSDAATATKAAAAAEKGLNCPSGNLYASDGTATRVTISTPTTLPSSGAVQGGDVWSVKGTAVTGTAVLVKYGDTHLALMTFFAPSGTDTSKLPDVQKIVEAAVTKFLS